MRRPLAAAAAAAAAALVDNCIVSASLGLSCTYTPRFRCSMHDGVFSDEREKQKYINKSTDILLLSSMTILLLVIEFRYNRKEMKRANKMSAFRLRWRIYLN